MAKLESVIILVDVVSDLSSSSLSRPLSLQIDADISAGRRGPADATLTEIMSTARDSYENPMDSYYGWIPCNAKLLARSSKEPMPPSGDMPPVELSFWKQKLVEQFYSKRTHLVGSHPIKQKLEDGLRQSILEALATLSPNKWISLNFVRIGHEKIAEQNPVTIWVVVEKSGVLVAEAQRVVDKIDIHCKTVGLHDIEVEIMECRRTALSDDEETLLAEVLLKPSEYPLVGASIAMSSKEGTTIKRVGTLGGYIKVEGKPYALTNHHVLFGEERMEAFPTNEELSSQLSVDQPAQRDLEEQVLDIETHLKGQRRRRVLDNVAIQRLEEDLAVFKSWQGSRLSVGSVFKSSGIRTRIAEVGGRHRLDWALIDLGNPARFSQGVDNEKFVNELPESSFSYLRTAIRIGGLDVKDAEDMPIFLKRALTFQEALNRQSSEDKDQKYVLWKHGRTTQSTFGVASDVKSNYRGSTGLVSDEFMIQDWEFNTFCDVGDSGSFVFDTDGHVVALLWGGNKRSTFATPIEAVLDDIKNVCGTDNVELVVRTEDRNDVVFGLPELVALKLPDYVPSTGPSLFDDEATGS